MNSSSNGKRRRPTSSKRGEFVDHDDAEVMAAMKQRCPNWNNRSSETRASRVTPGKAPKLSAHISNLDDIPYGPVFYPTVEDMEGSPLDFIEKIRDLAQPYGICKIVPPNGWNPKTLGVKFDSTEKFETKLQFLHRLSAGMAFGDGLEYNLRDYQTVSSLRANAWKVTRYPFHVDVGDGDGRWSPHKVYKSDSSGVSADYGRTESSNSRRPSATGRRPDPAQQYTIRNLERDYWDVCDKRTQELCVEYGNDIDTSVFGSGFPLSERGRCISEMNQPDPAKKNLPEPQFGTPDYYKETYWNLNNLPNAPTSVLRHIDVGIQGVNIPWLYFGCLFGTFCWHTEDNYFYSCMYLHTGAPKQWYGCSGEKGAAEGVERVIKAHLATKMEDAPDLLHHITTMISPMMLHKEGIPVVKLVQHPGEFIVTFPRAFHSGFSYGPNVGEAVNFACQDWIPFGSDACIRYRAVARPAVVSHDRLTFCMAHHHLHEQKSYRSCLLLLQELQRIVDDEIQQRLDLQVDGVRDVSHLLHLPTNDYDKFGEESAKYDDKRTCFHCRHICFLSAVVCECNQSRVSCLHHAHSMCRCPMDKRYFLIWNSRKSLLSTLERVRNHSERLKFKDTSSEKGVYGAGPCSASIVSPERGEGSCKAKQRNGTAPGAEMDLLRHRRHQVPATCPIVGGARYSGVCSLSSEDGEGKSPRRVVSVGEDD